MKPSLLAFVILTACTPSPDDIVVTLAPEVVSSLDGTLSVHAEVFAQRAPSTSQKVSIAIDYTDRNGTAHTIAPVEGKTDTRGAFDTTISGLTWDGTGTVTVTEGKLTGSATFAVLDRTPPTVTIVAPPNNQVHQQQNTTIQVHATDEIGVSQVFLDSSIQGVRDRATIIASGATDTTTSFDFQADQIPVGTTITLYALAADMSGNEGGAQPITVTVVQ